MKYYECRSLKEALKHLKDDCGLSIVSGGTDLILNWRNGNKIKGFLDISHIAQLKGITEKKGWITIGTATTHEEIANNQYIKNHVPGLANACHNVGSLAIRNKGTIGGNLANASPASDSAPALLCYDAALILENERNAREVKIENFFKEYKKTETCHDEILTKIMIPPTYESEITKFYKIGTRNSVSIAKVNACFRIKIENNIIVLIRIAFGSVAATPIRLTEIEGLLLNQTLDEELIQKVKDEVINILHPIDDIRSTADYRSHIAANWLCEFLSKIINI